MDVRLAPGAPDACFRRRFEASFIGGMEPVLAAMGMSPDEFERRMAETGVVRTVEVDGGKAGFVWTELRGRTLHVHALLLDEAFRGPGIGSTVLRLLESEAAAEADELELGVQDANVAARRLYEKAGVREVRGRPEIGFRVLRKEFNSTG